MVAYVFAALFVSKRNFETAVKSGIFFRQTMYLLPSKKYRLFISTLNYFQIFNDNINLSETAICVSATNFYVFYGAAGTGKLLEDE